MTRFLIVQLGDIGDLVLSTPALDALREAHPTAYIAVLTSAHAAPILDGTALADEIIVFSRRAFGGFKSLLSARTWGESLAFARRLRRGRFDTLLYFHRFTTRGGALKFALIALAARSQRRVGLDNGSGFFLTDKLPDGGFGRPHQAEAWLQIVAHVGASGTARALKISKTMPPVSNPLSVDGDGRKRGVRVAIHAGSGGDSYARRWSPERFAHVADRLHDEIGAEIVLIGGAMDDTPAVIQNMRAPYIDLTGRTTLPELAYVLSTCDVFIGADSGVMHVAAASGVPVVAIFGPSNPQAWRPHTPEGRSVVVRSAPECSPCSYVGHELGERRGCAARTCMHLVTVDQVAAAARALLTTPPNAPRDPQAEQTLRPSVDGIEILGFPVSIITYDRWLDVITSWVDMPDDRLHHVCTINPEMIMIARRDPIFAVVLRRAAVTVPDGVGLLWAARQYGRYLPERVTGSDGVPRIAAAAAQQGWRLFLLGAAQGVAQKAAESLLTRYPGLQIVGVYAGSPAAEHEDAIVERINAAGADILFVAYGAPEQDKWLSLIHI